MKEISEYYHTIRDNIKIYNSFPSIVKKAEQDGYLQYIYMTLNHIFQKEIQFAIHRTFKRNQKNENWKPETGRPKPVGVQLVCFQRKHEDNSQFIGLVY